MSGANRDRLLQVKQGQVLIDAVIAEAEALTEELEDARRSSPLPLRGDIVRAEQVL